MKHLIYILVLLYTQSYSQVDLPLFSEPAKIVQQVGNTQFSIQYERPKTNNRLIYGGLVPYDEVWRTGAGMCTTLQFSKDVFVQDQKIPAGKYALLTIPSQKEWTIILNKDTTLYGAYHYKQELDLIRLKVQAKKTDHWAEAFTIYIDVVNDMARIHLHWGETIVSFDLETRTYDLLREQIVEVIKSNILLEKGKYANIADYIIHNKSGFGEEYLNLADQLMQMAFQKEAKSSFNYRVKLDVLKLQNRRDKFMKVAQEEIEYLEKEKPYEGWELSIQEVKAAMANFDSQ